MVVDDWEIWAVLTPSLGGANNFGLSDVYGPGVTSVREAQEV